MTSVVLDHLAVAVRTWTDGRSTLADTLGGRWRYGLNLPAFNPCQLSYDNDTRIELLEPPDQGRSFVTRFLESTRGENRPHHITFKTNDILAVLERAAAHGIEPVLVSLENPSWREAFLHPRDTRVGVLIQIAESPGDPAESMSEDIKLPCPWPENDELPPASIEFITVAVPDPGAATDLLCSVLGGEVVATTADYTRVAWRTGADIVLITDRGPTDADRRPGVRHLAVRMATTPDVPLQPRGADWATTPILPELGIALLVSPS